MSRLSFIETAEQMLESISNPEALGHNAKSYYH